MADAAELVRLRRDLHQHAELAFTEVYAASTIIHALEGIPGIRLRTGAEIFDRDRASDHPSEEDFESAASRALSAGADPAAVARVRRDGTAVVAEIDGVGPGPLWGVRADIDALPITESRDPAHLPAREGFVSDWGTMHACGHDGHTAIGIVLARRLAADRDFAGTVRILFQPAEESVRGAVPMIAAGAADGIDLMLGLHLGEGLDSRVCAGGSHGLQATRKFVVEFTGVAAHAAGSPQDGRNAIAAAATATLGMLALSRDSRGVTNVNVGTISGGRQTNIVPDSARLTGEVRSDDSAVCTDMMRRIESVVEGAATMWRVDSAIRVNGRADTMRADPELVRHLTSVAAEVAEVAEVRDSVLMSASDDLSLWARAVQDAGGLATFAVVGASSPAPHHNPRFDIDEACLPVACDWLEAAIRGWRAR